MPCHNTTCAALEPLRNSPCISRSISQPDIRMWRILCFEDMAVVDEAFCASNLSWSPAGVVNLQPEYQTSSRTLPSPLLRQILHLIHHPDPQTTARTHSDVRLLVLERGKRDLEPIATRTRVVVDLQRGVVGHVFDLDFVVDFFLFLCSLACVVFGGVGFGGCGFESRGRG
jgi:hypothetical protein